jgi:hypothetical protein
VLFVVGCASHSKFTLCAWQYMVVYGGVACFSRIQMVSLEKGLKEYHMQQDSLEVLRHSTVSLPATLPYGAAAQLLLCARVA